MKDMGAMKEHKLILGPVLLLVGTLLVITVVPLLYIMVVNLLPREQYFPEDGVWYCEELEMQMSFETDVESYATVEQTRISCCTGYERGSDRITVYCQSFDNPYYKVGEAVFTGEHVSLEERQLVLRADDGRDYVFERRP